MNRLQFLMDNSDDSLHVTSVNAAFRQTVSSAGRRGRPPQRYIAHHDGDHPMSAAPPLPAVGGALLRRAVVIKIGTRELQRGIEETHFGCF